MSNLFCPIGQIRPTSPAHYAACTSLGPGLLQSQHRPHTACSTEAGPALHCGCGTCGLVCGPDLDWHQSQPAGLVKPGTSCSVYPRLARCAMCSAWAPHAAYGRPTPHVACSVWVQGWCVPHAVHGGQSETHWPDHRASLAGPGLQTVSLTPLL